MKQTDEQTFLANIRQQLDDDVKQMDELTVAKLTAARKRAIASSGSATKRMPLFAGLATAAAVLLVVALLQNPVGLQLPLDQMDAIASSEDVELIEDLDFYDWLETAQMTDEQSSGVLSVNNRKFV